MKRRFFPTFALLAAALGPAAASAQFPRTPKIEVPKIGKPKADQTNPSQLAPGPEQPQQPSGGAYAGPYVESCIQPCSKMDCSYYTD